MADWKSLYPFESQYLEIPKSETSADKIRMHYVEQGSANPAVIDSIAANPDPMQAGSAPFASAQLASAQRPAGDLPTVLCVHGNPTWSFTYREILMQCSDRARVIAVDHIGCGLSDKPQKYNYSLEQHVGNLARFIEQLDLRNLTLILHDWGGAIGLGAALKHPTRIKRLLLLNTAAFPPPYVPLRIRMCRLPWIGNWSMRRLNLFARAALKMTLNRLPHLDKAVAEGLIYPYRDWNSRVAIARFVQDIPRRPSQPTWQLLTRIEQGSGILADLPVRMVWGMRDWCFRPECLARLEMMFPNAKVRKLNDVGHYVMEEAAEEVVEELRGLLSE